MAKYCTKCGREVVPGKRFCAGCGQALPVEVPPAQENTAPPVEPVAPVCAQCGAALPPGKRFCTQCGHAVDSAATASPVEAVAAAPVETAAVEAAVPETPSAEPVDELATVPEPAAPEALPFTASQDAEPESSS